MIIDAEFCWENKKIITLRVGGISANPLIEELVWLGEGVNPFCDNTPEMTWDSSPWQYQKTNPHYGFQLNRPTQARLDSQIHLIRPA